MEIKTKRIITKSPKSDKPNENRSLDKYKEFLGEKKDVKKSKDKKVFHVTRKRISPKKIKKVDNPRDLLKIENDIAGMKNKDNSSSIHMPTQNENLTTELNDHGSQKDTTTKPEPVKAEPVKSEPVKSEPVKSEPVKSEPAKPLVKKHHKNTARSVTRTNKRSKTRGNNRRVSVKNSNFNEKDFKQIQNKLKEIRSKKSEDIKKELEAKGVKVTGKSNRLLRDIYLYSKLSNINITHEK
jgi:cell division septation protein DedD